MPLLVQSSMSFEEVVPHPAELAACVDLFEKDHLDGRIPHGAVVSSQYCTLRAIKNVVISFLCVQCFGTAKKIAFPKFGE